VCSSGVGFDPVIDGEAHTFEYAGLYNGLFVMADVATGSVWTHYDGTVLQGSLADRGLTLPIRPLVHTTWERWLEEHPETLVLDRIEAYESNYGTFTWGDTNIGNPWLGAQFTETLVGELDDRLAANELVLGAGVGDEYRAYALAHLDGPTVVNDVLDGHPIVVVMDPDNLFGMAFSSVVDGEVRTFEIVGDDLVDETSARWSVEGLARGASDSAPRLSFVTSFVTEWYGWSQYHPSTSVYVVADG
jgi:hypothetical protein